MRSSRRTDIGTTQFSDDRAVATGPTRRRVLQAGGSAMALGAAGRWAPTANAQTEASTPVADATPAASACVLTPELTEGPYYLQGELIRRDITEGKSGVPLRLRIAVTDPTSCAPLVNAAVDIWHCDAQGYYSGISSNRPGGDADPNLAAEAATQTFLRGIQLTDKAGMVEFDTIYPGWYISRTIHIHMKVTVDGTASETDAGGHVAHTGQLFFDDAITDEVFALEPYVNRPEGERTRNNDDNIFGDHEDEPGFLVDVTSLTDGSTADGYLGTITVGVDPTATPSASGGGPGGPLSGGTARLPPGDDTRSVREQISVMPAVCSEPAWRRPGCQ